MAIISAELRPVASNISGAPERGKKQGSVHSVLFDAFSDIPDTWYDVCRRDDLAMDLRALSVFQRTLKEQCRCWGLIVFDDSGIVIGCAALCAFPGQGFGQMNVLFCGLPVPSGSTHLRIRDGACIKTVMEEIKRVMRNLAVSAKSRLLVFKEFDEAAKPLAAYLLDSGYIRGEIPPMHVLETRFTGFAQYQAALKSRYRAQIRRSKQKLLDAGFEIVCGRGTAFFMEHFDQGAHQLYVAVQRRAKHKLELMPAAFFSELAKELGDEVSLTLIRRGGRVCAFTFAITRSDIHFNLYSGLDYALNNEGDLYFNLFYADMDQAFRAKATSLHMGQTSDDFKSRLGTKTEKLYFYVCALSPAFNALLRLVSPLAFPKVASVESHDVFSTAPLKKKR